MGSTYYGLYLLWALLTMGCTSLLVLYEGPEDALRLELLLEGPQGVPAGERLLELLLQLLRGDDQAVALRRLRLRRRARRLGGSESLPQPLPIRLRCGKLLLEAGVALPTPRRHLLMQLGNLRLR
jgi:hypothetical protein